MWHTSSFKLAFGFGLMVLAILSGIFSVYYIEIVGRVSQQLDDDALRTSKRLLYIYERQGMLGLQKEIDFMLSDGIDSQSEVLILQNREGLVWAGNAVADLRQSATYSTELQDMQLEREDRLLTGRVKVHALAEGRYLLAGSDLQPLIDIRNRYFKATSVALALVVGMALIAAWAFLQLMDQRAAALRRAMHQAGQGNLRFRLPARSRSDEFSLLEQDINQMLEQLEQLVHGIRHVSNMVAHNLRTPLSRTLRYIQAAMDAPPSAQPAQLERAQEELQQLSRLFTKMLLLAEMESGVGRQGFTRVCLRQVVQDVLEFYAPIFSDCNVTLHTDLACEGWVMGDVHLLANAMSNILDNFLKYGAGPDGSFSLSLRLHADADHVHLYCRDHGPGVTANDLPKLGRHFFRVAAHAQLPGHGIGLASLRAIAALHQGEVCWSHARPGLTTTLQLPGA